MSEKLAKILGRGMAPDMRVRFERLIESMLRDLAYIDRDKHYLVENADYNGWSLERIRVLIVLNAFNRLLMAPLSSAFEVELSCGVGSVIPVQYGSSLKVDRVAGAGIRRTLSTFRAIVARAGIEEYWLTLPGTSDLVYSIGRLDSSDEG